MYLHLRRQFYDKFHELGMGHASWPLAGWASTVLWAFLNLRLFVYERLNPRKRLSMTKQEAFRILHETHPPPNELTETSLTASTCDLSVVIPVYQAEGYIRRCIDSVLNQQTSYRFEILAVNDNSSDKSLEILQSYEDPRVRTFTIAHGGAAGARNLGIRQAAGRYIMFLDADDRLLDNSIEHLLSAADEHSADIVEGNYHYIKNGKQVPGKPWSKSTQVIKPDEQDYAFKLQGFPWGKVYRKELFHDALFPLCRWEDTMTILIYTRRSVKNVIIPSPVYEYLVHDSIETGEIRKAAVKNLDAYYVVNQIIELNRKLRLPEDGMFYKLILMQFGKILYHRNHRLGDTVMRALLVTMKDTLEKLRHTVPADLSYRERKLQQAILEPDMGLYLKSIF